MKNPNCEGSGPCANGEVRLLPNGTDAHHGNMILCELCHARELRFRRERNLDLADDCMFRLPPWESLEVCQ